MRPIHYTRADVALRITFFSGLYIVRATNKHKDFISANNFSWSSILKEMDWPLEEINIEIKLSSTLRPHRLLDNIDVCKRITYLFFRRSTDLKKDQPKQLYLPNLETLYCNNKQLNHLPFNLSLSKKIKHLNLSNNGLSEIPEEIYSLKKMEWLNLRHNKINYLPSDFANLKNLKDLSLAKNNLSDLPQNFDSLSHLEDLDLSDNNLRTIPIEITQLPKLKSLNLEGNPISDKEKKNIGWFLPQVLHLKF